MEIVDQEKLPPLAGTGAQQDCAQEGLAAAEATTTDTAPGSPGSPGGPPEEPPIPPDAGGPEEPDEPEEPGLSRRQLLVRGGAGLAVTAAIGVGGADLAKPLWHLYKDWRGRDHARDMFRHVLFGSHKLDDYEGMLQIDPLVCVVHDDIFGPPEASDWPNNGFIVAVRPIGVRDTLLRNVADASASIQDEVDRVLPDISPSLVAFYKPNPGKIVYLDVAENAGNVIPLTQAAGPDDPLPMFDVNVTGREIRGNVVYPYTQQPYLGDNQKIMNELYNINTPKVRRRPDAIENILEHVQTDLSGTHIVQNYSIIGHSITVSDPETLDRMANLFEWWGINPVPMPSA